MGCLVAEMRVQPQIGTKFKRFKVESSKWKGKARASHTFHLPLFTAFCPETSESHFTAAPEMLISTFQKPIRDMIECCIRQIRPAIPEDT